MKDKKHIKAAIRRSELSLSVSISLYKNGPMNIPQPIKIPQCNILDINKTIKKKIKNLDK